MNKNIVFTLKKTDYLTPRSDRLIARLRNIFVKDYTVL
jgi:hypothetical protein